MDMLPNICIGTFNALLAGAAADPVAPSPPEPQQGEIGLYCSELSPEMAHGLHGRARVRRTALMLSEWRSWLVIFLETGTKTTYNEGYQEWGAIMSSTTTIKSERVNLRLDKTAKQRIEQAASVVGKTVSGFIVSSALENAEKTIRKHETMVLSRHDAELFFDAIINPPPLNNKLRKALDEHGRRVISR